MTFDTKVTHEAQQTRVVITGKASPGQLDSLMHVLAVDSAGWRGDAVQIDLRGLEACFTPAEKSRLAAEAKRQLRRFRTIELLWAAED